MEYKTYSNYLTATPPLTAVNLGAYCQHYELPAHITAGIMFEGVTGTYMDKLAAGMLAIAKQSGKLAAGMPLIEVSSGTFGIALTLVGVQLGHPVYLVMPATADAQRMHMLRCLGANIVTTKPVYGRDGAVKKAFELQQELNGYFLNYMSNDDNPEYHRRVTGPALLAATGKNADIIVAGVGSGGTVTGVGEHIKAWTNGVQIVAVEPYESCVISGGFAGRHGIPGLGVGFIPENYNPYIVDEVVSVSTGDAIKAAQDLLKLEGIPAASASGAVVAVAHRLAQRPQNKGKNIVALLGIRQEL